ncbi:MAG TPA: hypothetical protein PKO06_21315, partial [Candidatus Ozemobacteraceae bacterium]|nr:hypothetical protein [Candidatus Ozemobacteraceae bacterium]
MAEIEALGSSSEKLLFDLKLVQLWQRSQSVPPATPSQDLPNHAQGAYAQQPHHDSSGWIEGYQEAGFAPVFVHAAATETRAITVFKRIGSGTLAVDMQNFGHRDQAQMRWKFFNLCDLPHPLLKTINGTCAGGMGAPERQLVPLPAGRYLLQITAADGQGSPDSYLLTARFPVASQPLPLVLCGTMPDEGMSGIHPECPIRLTFNQPVAESSFRPDQITITGEQSGVLPWQHQFLTDEHAILLRLRSPAHFADGEQVSLRVGSQAITSRDGTLLGTDTSVNFRIGRTIRTDARLTLQRRNDGAMGIGRHEFTVTSSHPLRQAPALTCITADGRKSVMGMSPSGALTWQGSLDITAETCQGKARITATAVAENGDPLPAPLPLMVFIDTQPPVAPIAAPIARAVAGGQVEVSWAPPPDRQDITG